MAITVIAPLEIKNDPEGIVVDGSRVGVGDGNLLGALAELSETADVVTAPFVITAAADGVQIPYNTWAGAVAALLEGDTLTVRKAVVEVETLPSVACIIRGENTNFVIVGSLPIAAPGVVWYAREMQGGTIIIAVGYLDILNCQLNNMVFIAGGTYSGGVRLFGCGANGTRAILGASGQVWLTNSYITWVEGGDLFDTTAPDSSQVILFNSSFRGTVSDRVTITTEIPNAVVGDTALVDELEDAGNWTGAVYSGPVLRGFSDGRTHKTDTHLYMSINGTPVRLARV